MAESVILSAIESLDTWLNKKPELLEETYGKLCSLLFDNEDLCSPLAELREDMKENLYSLLLGMADFGEDDKEKLYNFLNEIAYFTEDSMKKLYSFLVGIMDFSVVNKSDMHNLLRDFLKEYKEKLYSLLAGMTDFREDDKEKMHNLLVGMLDFWEDNNKEKLYSLLVRVVVLADSVLYENELIVNKKNILYSLLVEMAELWEDDDKGKQDKEKLHTLLHEITDLTIHYYTRKRKGRVNNKLYKKKVYSLMADIACVCKTVKGKLNKEKVYTWLAKKAELSEHNGLFRLLLNVAFNSENKNADESVRDIVEGIKDELRWILDFLRGNKWDEGSSLHYFVFDAVEMAHNAQALVDVRDSYPFLIFHILNHEEHDFINQDGHRFVKKIHAIQNWIQETKELMLQFRVERESTKSQKVEGVEGVVVGLEEDIKLLCRSRNLRPFSKPGWAPLPNTTATHTTLIRGMAGIGKTTLARVLSNHKAIVREFECRAWVCVSWESSRREVLMKLIQQVVDNKEFEKDVEYLEKMDNKGLKQMLHQHLKGRRYFIVLDDVWKNTFLKYVMKALPKDNRSRLLLTTCCADVQCNPRTSYDHTMRFLDEDKSWQLLLKTILFFGTSEKFPKHLETRGRKMLAKCNGLPLAIKEVGRQWAQKRQLMSEWEDQLLESLDLSETLEALESTYQNLDPQVKSCFLHLSVFKEGTSIKSRKLRYLWVVGGAVSGNEKYSRNFISELAKASIIDETQEKRMKTCRINPVFHKLSIKKAEDEMRLEILRKDGNTRLSENPRHRVIYCGREKFTYSTNQSNNHLVSLFFYGGGYFDANWKHFEQLKILDMEDFGLKILPDAVGMLTELRYLGLRNNYLQVLPRSLCQLKYLEVLDIALNFMMEVSDIIWEIGSLRHLYMSDIIFQKPMKMDTLKNLQTLTRISINDWVCELSRSGMEMLSGLRKLGIEEMDRNSDISKLFASLAKLRNLDHLILRGFRYRSMPPLEELGILSNLRELKLEGRLEKLPSANNFPQKLRYLTLVNSSLEEDPMPVLANLEDLEYLNLWNAYIGKQMVIPSDGFFSITHLVIGELWNLRNILVTKKKCLPYHLGQLEIINCPYLETFLEDIAWTGDEELNLLTTKNIARKILRPDFRFSKLCKLKILS